MAKFKFPRNEVEEYCERETADCVVYGYRYKGERVFTVIAHTKQEARESMNSFLENNCK